MPTCTCITSSPNSSGATCRSRSRCCRWWRAPSSRTPTRPASAAGLWQFIPGTGSRFGLKQDWWYDGRRDIVESTRAALDYLQYLHDEFNGDWLLAIAAYNCGEAMVERAAAANRAAGRSVDFWSLWLPGETRAYVPKLLAMKRLVSDPEAYGIAFSPIPNQPYFARVPTDGQINMKLAAEIAGISPAELYELNPAFHRFATDPSGPFFLLLPVEAADVFSENVVQLTEEQRLGLTRYTVRRGDSVVSVAKHFNTTATVIREMNDLPQGPLTVGEDVRVPSAVTDLPAKVMLAAAQVDGGHGRSRTRAHVQVVRRGDSLWTIARRHGMSVDTLAMMNGMHPDDALRAGQHIKLSQGSGRAAQGAPHDLHGARGRHRRADRAALPVQRAAAARLERPELQVPHPHRPEAAHPPRRAPRLKRAGAIFARAPRAAALCGIIRAGGLQHGFPERQTRLHRGRRHRPIDRLGHRAGDAA